MLVMVLAFGFMLVGCSSGDSSSGGGGGAGGGADTWSDITSLTQLNGTWKTSYSNTENEAGMTIKYVIDMTITINATNATTGTMSGSQIMTISYSGNDINDIWADIKAWSDGEGWTFNDSAHSMSKTETISSQAISTSDDDEKIQINQNGTKMKIPAGIMEEDSPEIIFTKQ